MGELSQKPNNLPKFANFLKRSVDTRLFAALLAKLGIGGNILVAHVPFYSILASLSRCMCLHWNLKTNET